jgi:hypothetical protein
MRTPLYYVSALPGRHGRKGDMLAATRGPEQHRHDDRLGLTDTEENQIVAYLQTLTDGFTTPYKNADTFTGQCMTGGDARTQGNETIIPTWSLAQFPCATDICGVPPVPKPVP